jgi:Uma2 family endonuclease
MMRTLDELLEALGQLSVEQRMTARFWLQELDNRPAPENQVREARPVYGVSDASFMTLEEFFEFEEKSPVRHEFINGVLFAMNGASLDHGRIVRNLTVAIATHLKRGPCEVFSSGLKAVVRRDINEVVYYPDVFVDCRPDTHGTNYVQDPKLIVEVLSPSTQTIDKREKLQNYRLIDSVEEYVLVAQDERRVIIYPRAERWKPRMYDASDAAVELRSIDLAVPMNELYEGVLLTS